MSATPLHLSRPPGPAVGPAPAAEAPGPGPRGFRLLRRPGLVPRLVLVATGVITVSALILTAVATRRLEEGLTRSYESQGQALALSLASAAEGSVANGLWTVQSLIDSFRSIEGVRYLWLADTDGSVLAHTFSPQFPEALAHVNPVQMGELSATQRVKVAHGVDLRLVDDTRMRAIDVAAPVSGGALGVVHVGLSQEAIDDQVAALRQRMLALALALMAAGAVVAGLFGRHVARPLRELTRVTARVVETGDLTQTVRTGSEDEVGQLARSFGRMMDKLRAVTVDLQQAVAALTRATGDLSTSAEAQSQIVGRQAAALQEAHTTVQALRQGSELTAQKADAVLTVAERADTLGHAGEQALETTLAGLSGSRDLVGELLQHIQAVGARSSQIDTITQAVKGLADQSNMLALNAAIEAVRSGEHGKGFGVVAREIRALADQSIQSTERVREILEDIQRSVQGAESAAEQGVTRVELGLTQARASGESLRELSSIVRDNAEAARQIAAAVSQQHAGIAQLTVAVEDLSGMMSETVSRLQTTTRATGTLQSLAERLTSVASSYRVE